MSYIDLQATLAEWPYDSEQISVRKILGNDGSVRIQMRVELGVLQMESQGCPDGSKPHGCESELAYHRRKLAKFEECNGTTMGYVITPQQCNGLRTEASLYYRRYVALFVLEEYEDVIRDTDHTLAVFELCREFAHDEDDRSCLESFRPYVLMMNARARALLADLNGDNTSAIAHVNRGIMHIKSHFGLHEVPDMIESSEELRMLRALGKELAAKIPGKSVFTVQKALRIAVEKEQFEEAARLRDMLEDLGNEENSDA